jgi:predicted metal-dependent TIM-barrel fold hydrolase
MAFDDFLIKQEQILDLETAQQLYEHNLLVRSLAGKTQNYELAALARTNVNMLNDNKFLQDETVRNTCEENATSFFKLICNDGNIFVMARKILNTTKPLMHP